MKNLFDSHCHLNDPETNAEEAIFKAKENGIDLFLVVGWNLASSKKAVELAEKYDCVYAAVGVHPENYEDEDDHTLDEIAKLAESNKVIAIGEIGLDYHWKNDDETKLCQKEWFVNQIRLANRLELPVTIHARDASEDVLNIIKQNPIKSGFALHCYSGSPEMMKEFEKLGAYFGFDGPITYKNAKSPKECVRVCPLDRILIETDAPYLPPVPHRGERNEPAYIKEIFNEMVSLKETDADRLSDQLNVNFERLFKVKR